MEELLNSLILKANEVSEDVMRTIDILFNNNKINRFIPLSFASTLCLVINALYLKEAAKAAEELSLFEWYVSIINYCYVLYNNLWAEYEQQMEKNDFGVCLWCR